jgi:hypothetical protein
MSPNTVSLWWDGPAGQVFNSNVGPWGSDTRLSLNLTCSFLQKVTAGTSVYYYDPFTTPSPSPSPSPSIQDPARGTLVLLEDAARSNPSLSDLTAFDRELLQFVHYDKGQEYTAHHDFSFPKGRDGSKHKPRSINLCMYLNDVPDGGETSFPRWRYAETSDSLDVRPEKGKAMLFYMINPDGNLDDLTQHAALPVIEGGKYVEILWISNYQKERNSCHSS